MASAVSRVGATFLFFPFLPEIESVSCLAILSNFVSVVFGGFLFSVTIHTLHILSLLLHSFLKKQGSDTHSCRYYYPDIDYRYSSSSSSS